MKRISLRISPMFLVTAAIIGILNSFSSRGTFSLLGVFIWIGIIFVSVLFHELGHALTCVLFKQRAQIELIAFGGVTIPSGPKLNHLKEFIVVFMGPFFGFLLFVFASLLILLPITNPLLFAIIQTTRWVNLFWTFINLLPIMPLDGGQLVRIILDAIFGAKSWKLTLYVSFFVSLICALASFLMGIFIIGIIFLIFTFQSIEAIRKVGHFSEADQDEENKRAIQDIEKKIALGQHNEVISELERLVQHAKKGIIFVEASEYLAKIFYDKGEYKKSYDLLKPIEKYVSRESKLVLYLSAYEVKDFSKVVALSGVCFQESQTFDVAVRAAASNAQLRDIKKSIEWLKTVRSFNQMDLNQVVKDTLFDPIRSEDAFKKFISS